MKTKKIIVALLYSILFIFQLTHVEASNKITVASIGGRLDISDVEDSTNPVDIVNTIIKYWDGRIAEVLPDHPDLIVLTEACDLPGNMSPEEQFKYYEVRKNQVLEHFSSVAKANQCYIAFGMHRMEDGVWWNSCILLDRNGDVSGIYNKNYPPINELDIGIVPGTEMPVFQCDFGKVVCTICFDLNFDELRNRCAALKPDLVVFPALYHGGLEQEKWAYSSRSYFVCSYGGNTAPSEIRNPLGKVVASSTNYHNYAVANINLDQEVVHLDGNWGKLSALKQKYKDEVIITDPGKLGVVMITSEKTAYSALEMVAEFDIELVDEYFNRSRANRVEQFQ